MSPQKKNIDIVRRGVPERLRRLREDRCLTREELAERAGVSYRTILNIEKPERERAQAKTLMLIAQALGVPFAELMGDPGPPENGGPRSAEDDRGDRRRSWQRVRPGLLLLLCALLIGARLLWPEARTVVHLDIEDGRITASRGPQGKVLWSAAAEAPIAFSRRAPWDGNVLLVGRTAECPDGGSLVALSAADGDTLWRVAPDTGSLLEAFGPDHLTTLQFHCRHCLPADVDGDGVPELVVYFQHYRWFPACVCLVGRDGRIRGQYDHMGFLYAFHAEDLDGDGRQEVLVGGINNAPAWQGPTIVMLDEAHWNGASVEPALPSYGRVPDGSRRRLTIPHFPEPFRSIWTDRFLAVTDLSSGPGYDGGMRVNAVVSIDDAHLLLELDADLAPLDVRLAENFRDVIQAWPDSLRSVPNPGERAWLTDWLAEYEVR